MGTKEFDTLNRYMVGVQGDHVAIVGLLDPRTRSGPKLTRDEAIMFAAWLLVMADMQGTPEEIRDREVQDDPDGIIGEVSEAFAAIENA